MTNEKSRVLGRKGARLVTEIETNAVSGGMRIETETLCSFDPDCGLDGDLFTGDCLAS